MADKNADEITEIARLHRWIYAVGGNISLGESTLKSVEESKDGDELTIVLKRKKQKKTNKNADRI